MYKKVLTACAGLVLLITGVALAGVPCAGTTTVVAAGNGAQAPDCAPGAVICPNGDYDQVVVTVTVRDCYGTPLAGRMVTVSASPAGPPFCFCPDGEDPPNDYEDTKEVGPTDALGQTQATFAKFGGCGNMSFYATIGTVTAGPSTDVFIASFDIGNDCEVELIDFGEFAKNYYSADPCYDYNCDGEVELIDFGEFAKHYYHSCTNP